MHFFVNDFGGPIETPTLYQDDGTTLLLPLSATITVLNLSTGTAVLTNGSASVQSGSAYYNVPSGSAITSTSARYVAYISVLRAADDRKTYPVYFDVLDLASYRLLDMWRRKVSESSPSDELTTDEAAREWIDDAVALVSRRYGITTYTSTLGALSPAPTVNDQEFYASIASLMARTAWHAGKGKWRDEEMSLDPGPIKDEWDRLDHVMQSAANADLYAVYDVFNRDRVYDDSYKYDSPLYYYTPSGSTQPSTTIPI